jgi:hypothetical protein
MTTASASPIVIDDTALAAETAAQTNGLSADVIREQVKEEAIAQARKNLEQSAADANNPYKAMYEREREQREIVENTLQSIRAQGQKSSTSAGGPPVSAAQAQARAGAHEWNHRLTDSQKIAALGVDPSTVNLAAAKKIFGRGADAKLGIDLMKSDPSRYKVLKQVALATGRYGA